MGIGAAFRFEATDSAGSLTEANLNSLEPGGNVYQQAGVGNELNVTVSALDFWRKTGAQHEVQNFAGTASQAVTPSQTNYLFVVEAGTLSINTSGFPAPQTTAHIPLATVVAGAVSISTITDARPHYIIRGGPTGIANYTVAGLPTPGAAGFVAYATNGRKDGEGGGGGTGTLCYWDNVAWRRVSDDSTVVA